MFGYVLPDKPNLYMKDYVLFRAYYCGLCHATKGESGQLARFGVNYDAAFISLFFHGLLGESVEVVEKRCILNPKKRAVIATTPLMERVCRLNLVLIGMKLEDDREDGEHHPFRRITFGRQVAKARKKEPVFAALADECRTKQREEEKNGVSIDAAAEPFADMMRKVFRELAGEKNTFEVERIGYLLGKYVYYMDALDDYDDDAREGKFNAFRRTFGAGDYAALKETHGDDVRFIAEEIIRGIEDAYRSVVLADNEGIVTNTLWYGLRWRLDTVLNKEKGKCSKIRL